MTNKPRSLAACDINTVVKQLFSLLPGGVSIALDSSCQKVIHNDIAARFLRIGPEVSLSLSCTSSPALRVFQAQRELQPHELPIQRAAFYGIETSREEYRLVWPDGVEKHCITSCKPLYGDDGQIVGAVATVEDITDRKQQQMELQRLDGELHYLFNAAKDIITVADINERRFIRVNPAVQQILGYSREEMTAQPFNTFFHPDDIQPMNEHRRRILRGDGPHNYLNRYRCKDGSYRWLSWTTVLDKDKRYSYSIARDITAQKEMEQELQRLDSELHQLYNLAEDIIGIADVAARRFIRVNPAVQRLLGYTQDEFTARPYSCLFHPDDTSLLDEQYRELIERKSGNHLLARYRAKTGDYKWISWVGVVDPVTMYSYCIGRDVTRQIETEQKLEELTRELRQLYAVCSDIIGIADQVSHSFTAVNPAVQKILGYTPDEFTSCSYFDLVHPDDLAASMQAETLEVGTHGIFSNRLRCKNGDYKWISWTWSHNHESNLIYAIGRDITTHKAMEQEMLRLDRLNLAGELAVSIGHEIRNPMTTVRGYLQLMLRKAAYAADRENIELMIEEIDRANGIISEFLSVAKTKAINRQATSLHELVQAILPLIEADAFMTSQEVVSELSKVPELYLDPKEIRQLVLNLTRNGLEAMQCRGTLTIKTYETTNAVVLEVSDRGPGIPDHVLERMFDPFYTNKPTGTGLGLSVCHRIAEQHKAAIRVDTSGKGTTFSVIFPLNANQMP